MELMLIIAVVVLIVWYFGRLIRRSLELGEEMAMRRLSRVNHEQKLAAVNYYDKVVVDTEKVSKAAGTRDVLEKLQI